MAGKADSQAALNAALRLLAYRPRSEEEVRHRLLRRFEPSLVQETVDTLRLQGHLDDRSLAIFWRENREQHRPRSKSMIRWELLRLGVERGVADEAVQDLDELESACRAGRRLLRRFKGVDANTFRHQMTNYLQRRGFGYRLAAQAIEKLWAELSDPVDGDVDGHTQV